MYTRSLFLLSLIALLIGCQVKPVPINYGSDGCDFCKMTIVDNQHAAELVTIKGKAFKYDAVECMMNHLKNWNHPDIEFHLVADFARPGELTDATQAHYLISDAIPSPMGEFLSAFDDRDKRDSTLDEVGGTALSWPELTSRFKVYK